VWVRAWVILKKNILQAYMYQHLPPQTSIGPPLTASFFLVQWPGGTYGLPMPDTGCPSDGVTDWKSGWTYHDTEDDNNENQRSNIFHMPGNFSAHGIQQKFCLKVGNNGNTGSEIWPEGKYCLYKKGS